MDPSFRDFRPRERSRRRRGLTALAIVTALAATGPAALAAPAQAAPGQAAPASPTASPAFGLARPAVTGNPLAYIGSGRDADTSAAISALDTGTNTVTASVPVDGAFVGDMAVNANGTTLYSIDEENSAVSVISTATDTITGTIPIVAKAIALSPSGATLYAAVTGGVAVINTATDTVTSTLPNATAFSALAVSPSGATIYGVAASAIVAISTATGAVTATIADASDPDALALSPDGTKAYVIDELDNSVEVIDTSADAVTATIPIGGAFSDGLGGVAVNPNGTAVYVTDNVTNEVAVINTTTDAVTATIADSGLAADVAVNPNGTTAYVVNDLTFTVTVINTTTATVTDTTAPISFTPYDIVLPTGTPTSTTLAVSPTGLVSQGTAVTLTATETPAVAGTVQFYDGATALGTPATVSSGTASYTTTALAPGANTVTAVFTPTSTWNAASASAPATIHVGAPLAIDQTVTKNGTGTVTTGTFTTTGPRLLVAYVSSDGPSSAQTATVTGAGLTWTLIQRADAKGTGTAEIWAAQAAGPLTNASITSTPKTSGYDQSLTVVSYTGASGIGATASASRTTGAPSVSLTTTAPGSWVFGVGEDYSRAAARTLGANQSLISQWVDTAPGETFWVQGQSGVTPSPGTSVTLNDTAPATDIWNLAAVEILAAS